MADVVDIPEFRAFYYTDDTPRQFYTLRRYEDESGSGEMHCYNIAPGIQLSFNDLNLSSCYQPLNVQKDFLEINYCLEGGHEVEMVGGGITFLGEKDLSISGLYHDKRVIVNSRIPFNKYKGITILLELETAQTTLDNEFSKWHIDLQKIRTTLCPEGRVLLIKSKQKIDHIFAEILSVENQIATASMDAESETMVQTALSALLKGRTVIVIAHRMRTIANADKIVVLDKGKVTEVGTPSELAKKGGLYAHLVALQQKQQMSSLPT